MRKIRTAQSSLFDPETVDHPVYRLNTFGTGD